eukprot:3104757-Prymnesium_polylepis.1
MLVPMRAWPTAHARIAHERARTRRCSTGPPQKKTPHNSKCTPVSSRAQHPSTHARQLMTNCHTCAQRRAQPALPHPSTRN